MTGNWLDDWTVAEMDDGHRDDVENPLRDPALRMPAPRYRLLAEPPCCDDCGNERDLETVYADDNETCRLLCRSCRGVSVHHEQIADDRDDSSDPEDFCE